MAQGLRVLQETACRVPAGPGSRAAVAKPRRLILQSGDHLFEAGDVGNEAFIVRSGHLKSYRLHRDGEEQILGVHGPGDVLGFDALTGRPASCSVVALEITSIEVARLDRNSLTPASAGSNEFASLIQGMYREMQRFSRLLYMDRHPAGRRLAEFLLDFSREESGRGRSQVDLVLPLNRRDLAKFLGLAPETLSRTFRRFQEQGILSVDNRQIHIVDFPAIREVAGE